MENKITGLVNMPNADYHAGPGISKSHLDAISGGTPLHYWSKYLDPNRERPEPTPAMVLGSAVHSAILEPDVFPTEYTTVPENAPNRPTAAQRNAKNPSTGTLLAIDYWDEFEAANKGKVILSPGDYSFCLQMRDAVNRHPLASRILGSGKAEQSFFAIDDETGELVKCRTDWLADNGLIADVKTTESASPANFGKSVANFRYYVQAAFYSDILQQLYGEAPPAFVFLAVEKTPPFAVAVYFATPEQIELGREYYRKDLNLIAECKRTGNWPGYPDEALPIELPRWFTR